MPRRVPGCGAAVAAAFPHCAIVEAACCAEALESLQAVRFELVLLDLGLPDGSGLQVLEELRHRQPDCPCVITTVFDDDEHLFKALRAGAAGYVLKDQSQHELGELLRQMLEGRPPMSPAIARRLLHHFGIVACEPAASSADTTGRRGAAGRVDRTRTGRAAHRGEGSEHP